MARNNRNFRYIACTKDFKFLKLCMTLNELKYTYITENLYIFPFFVMEKLPGDGALTASLSDSVLNENIQKCIDFYKDLLKCQILQ